MAITSAILRDDISYLKQHELLSSQSINTPINNNQDTMLIYAVNQGKKRLVRLLLSYGADTNIRNQVGQTALHLAIDNMLRKEECGIDQAKLLLRHHADPLIQDNEGNTILHKLATTEDGTEFFGYLNNKYDDLKSVTNYKNQIAGEIAALRKDTDKVLLYLKYSFDSFCDRYTLLYRAIDLCSVPLIEFITFFFKQTTPEYEIMPIKDPKRTFIEQYDPLLYAFRYRVLKTEVLHYLITKIIVNLDRHDIEGNCALHYATQYNLQSIVRLLINHGADKCCRNRLRCTPIHLAAVNQNLAIIKLLCLDDGTLKSLKQKNLNHETALTISLRIQNREIVKFILQVYFIRGTIWKDKEVQKHLKEIVEIMIPSSQHDIMLQEQYFFENNRNMSPTMCIIHDFHKQSETVCQCCLIEHEISHNSVDCKGDTLLYSCFKDGFYEFSEELMRQGAKLNHQDKEGNTFLHLAVKNQSAYFVRKDLQMQASTCLVNKNGKLALQLAFENCFHVAVELILNTIISETQKTFHELPISETKSEMFSVVFHHHNIELPQITTSTNCRQTVDKINCNHIVGATIENNCCPNNFKTAFKELWEWKYFSLKDWLGDNVVHVAVKCYDGTATGYNNIKLLFEMHLNLNKQDDLGETPLILTVQFKYLQLAKLLKQLGADMSIIDKQGFTAIDHALYHNFHHIFPLFSDDLCFRDAEKNSLLHLAVRHNCMDIIKLTIKHGSDINSQNNNGDTALHFCAENRVHTDTAEILISNGASPMIKNKSGNTALHLCLKRGNLNMGQLLIDCGASLFVSNDKGETPVSYIMNSRDNNFIRGLYDSLNFGDGLDFEKFECPICYEVAKQIYQCRNGHFVCGECIVKPIMDQCPQCRVPFRNRFCIRNNEMEAELIDMMWCKIQNTMLEDLTLARVPRLRLKPNIFNNK